MGKMPSVREPVVDKAGRLTNAWRAFLKALSVGPPASGTFTTADAKTVTVVDGVIVSIV